MCLFSVYLWLTLLISPDVSQSVYPCAQCWRVLVPACPLDFPPGALTGSGQRCGEDSAQCACVSSCMAAWLWCWVCFYVSCALFLWFTPLFRRKCSWEFSFWRLWQFACTWTSRLEILPQGLKSMSHPTAFLFPVLLLWWPVPLGDLPWKVPWVISWESNSLHSLCSVFLVFEWVNECLNVGPLDYFLF